MSKLLFVAHGMGVHGADWSTKIIGRLRKLSAQYPTFQGDKPFDKRVTAVPISYDSVFSTHLNEWSNSVAELKKTLTDKGMSLPFSMDWLEDASATEANFFWSNVVDVLLYRFFPIVTAEVRVKVAEQMISTLAKDSVAGGVPEAHVMAHSLGTSVMHDTLAHMAQFPIKNPDTGKATKAFTADRFTFETFIAIANVSRVLETTQLAYTSHVHPPSAVHNKAYFDRFYNVRHELDPFPAVKSFKPANWGDDYRPISINHIHQWNVHGYEHYLENPAVHVPILERVCRTRIKKTDVPPFPRHKVPGATQAKVENYAAMLKQVITLIEGQKDIRTLLVSMMQFLASAEEQP